jgi:hypothetical protein
MRWAYMHPQHISPFANSLRGAMHSSEGAVGDQVARVIWEVGAQHRCCRTACKSLTNKHVSRAKSGAEKVVAPSLAEGRPTGEVQAKLSMQGGRCMYHLWVLVMSSRRKEGRCPRVGEKLGALHMRVSSIEAQYQSNLVKIFPSRAFQPVPFQPHTCAGGLDL